MLQNGTSWFYYSTAVMESPPPAAMEERTPLDELSKYRTQTIFVSVIVFTITATISVILRLVAKKINRAKLQVEDYVIFLALVKMKPQPYSRRTIQKSNR